MLFSIYMQRRIDRLVSWRFEAFLPSYYERMMSAWPVGNVIGFSFLSAKNCVNCLCFANASGKSVVIKNHNPPTFILG